ncbi:MAG TPA: PEP-CTERM sorting domain-containing protein [Thermogutta sp.]|nr:PEP-CTERM sorting domain-containing protein [Thermogutta sp.]HQF15149.1 PEP-CTERM sorting domain-containing protein [Thermogutta sp.]
MRRIGQSLVILAFVLTVSGSAAHAGLVWLDPNNFSEGQQITVPFVTLSAVQGSTPQLRPDGRVLALSDSNYPAIRFFGWHIAGATQDGEQVPWRAKWANFQAEFESPVSYVSLDFYRNDFGIGTTADDIGFLIALDASNQIIWNEWVYLSGTEESATVEISLPEPQIKTILAGGVYVRSRANCNPGFDHDILITRLGYSVQPIPEPGTAVLLLSGAVIVGAIARFRRSKRSN